MVEQQESSNSNTLVGYWVETKDGCPIAGPFDLWRRSYFLENGRVPEDTFKMHPSLPPACVDEIAELIVAQRATASALLDGHPEFPELEIRMAHRCFSQWRRQAPFLPDSMQDLPLRPSRTTPETAEEWLADW